MTLLHHALFGVFSPTRQSTHHQRRSMSPPWLSSFAVCQNHCVCVSFFKRHLLFPNKLLGIRGVLFLFFVVADNSTYEHTANNTATITLYTVCLCVFWQKPIFLSYFDSYGKYAFFNDTSP